MTPKFIRQHKNNSRATLRVALLDFVRDGGIEPPT